MHDTLDFIRFIIEFSLYLTMLLFAILSVFYGFWGAYTKRRQFVIYAALMAIFCCVEGYRFKTADFWAMERCVNDGGIWQPADAECKPIFTDSELGEAPSESY